MCGLIQDIFDGVAVDKGVAEGEEFESPFGAMADVVGVCAGEARRGGVCEVEARGLGAERLDEGGCVELG